MTDQIPALWTSEQLDEPPAPFIPPAARNLPLAALDSATRGADALDARASTPSGRNFLAHALVQLARDGWLRTEPGEGFEPYGDGRPARPPQEPASTPVTALNNPSTSSDTANNGLREHLRTALHRFIDPVDDCMPALADDGHGFTWVTAETVLDELTAAIGGEPTPAGDNPLREHYAAHAFNAIAPALKAHDQWLPLSARRAVADAVLAVRDRELEQLRAELADEQAAYESRTAQWKRVVHSRKCAEQQRDQLAAALTEVLAVPRIPDSGGETAVHIGPVACVRVERWRGVLKAARQVDDGPSVDECRTDDRHWPLQKAGE